MRFFIFTILSLLIISCKSSSDNAPNIIVIISDDQGYADVGFHGSKEIFTPNIDRIASNGVVFFKLLFFISRLLPIKTGQSI